MESMNHDHIAPQNPNSVLAREAISKKTEGVTNKLTSPAQLTGKACADDVKGTGQALGKPITKQKPLNAQNAHDVSQLVKTVSAAPARPTQRLPAPVVRVTIGSDNKPSLAIGRETAFSQVAMQGGGAKGMVYASYLEKLDQEAQVLRDLKEVAGTSAGSAMACLVSTGVPLSEIKDYITKANVLEELTGVKKLSLQEIVKGRIKDRRQAWSQSPPPDLNVYKHPFEALRWLIRDNFKLERPEGTEHIQLDLGKFGTGGSALLLRKTLLDMSSKPTRDYVKSPEYKAKNVEAVLTKKYGQEFVDIALKPFQERVKAEFPNGVTFNDLKILHALEPEKFKLLNVTAYDKDAGKPVKFNAELTGNVFCYEAVAASMSLPGILKSVRIARHDPQTEGTEADRTNRLMDGGIGSNVPSELFTDRTDASGKNDDNAGKLFAMVFENNGKTKKIQESNLEALDKFDSFQSKCQRCMGIFLNKIGMQIDTKRKYTMDRPSLGTRHLVKSKGGRGYEDAVLEDARKINRLAGNVAVVPHGELDTTSFTAKAPQLEEAIEQTVAAALEFISDREIRKNYGNDCKAAVDALKPADLIYFAGIAPKEIEACDKRLQEIEAERTLLEVTLENLPFSKDPHAINTLIVSLKEDAAKVELEKAFYQEVLKKSPPAKK